MNYIPTLSNKEYNTGTELEGLETSLLPSGILLKVNGKSHANNGENVVLESGSKVYSKKIMLPKEIVATILGKDVKSVSKQSPADLSKQFDTKQYLDILSTKGIDERKKNSAELMLNKNLGQLETIFNAQEQFKADNNVQDGKLLSEQGLNGDLEKFGLGGKYKMQSGGLSNDVGDLTDHLFIQLGLGDTKYAFKNKEGSWDKRSDLTKLNTIKKAYKEKYGEDLTDKAITDITREYQRLSIGQREDGTYDMSPEAKRKRELVEKHINETPDRWKSQNEWITLPDGSKVVKNYVDGDNWKEQLKFKTDTPVDTNIPATRQPFKPVNPLPGLPLKPLESKPNPAIPQSNSIITSKSKREDIRLRVPEELDKAKYNEYYRLLSRDKAVPYLNQDKQTTAYNRFVPINTLSQERSQNFLNQSLENSDASSQMTQSVNADNYAKYLQGIDDVNLKNYQADMSVDNSNADRYMNAFNFNENARNRNMGEYVGRVQQVNDAFDKEGELMFDNIANLNLQKARFQDDMAQRRYTGIMSNDSHIVGNLDNRQGKYYTGVDKNPYFEQRKKPTSEIFTNNDLEKRADGLRKIFKNASDDKIIDLLKGK